jgi:hypothetical protein
MHGFPHLGVRVPCMSHMKAANSAPRSSCRARRHLPIIRRLAALAISAAQPTPRRSTQVAGIRRAALSPNATGENPPSVTSLPAPTGQPFEIGLKVGFIDLDECLSIACARAGPMRRSSRRACVAVFARVNHSRKASRSGVKLMFRVGVDKFSVIVDGKLRPHHLVPTLCGPLPAASALHRSETPVISAPSHTRILARKAVR